MPRHNRPPSLLPHQEAILYVTLTLMAIALVMWAVLTVWEAVERLVGVV